MLLSDTRRMFFALSVLGEVLSDFQSQMNSQAKDVNSESCDFSLFFDYLFTIWISIKNCAKLRELDIPFIFLRIFCILGYNHYVIQIASFC